MLRRYPKIIDRPEKNRRFNVFYRRDGDEEKSLITLTPGPGSRPGQDPIVSYANQDSGTVQSFARKSSRRNHDGPQWSAPLPRAQLQHDCRHDGTRRSLRGLTAGSASGSESVQSYVGLLRADPPQHAEHVHVHLSSKFRVPFVKV